MDIVIKSNGLLGYQELMGMPVDSLLLFVERLNHSVEEKNQAQTAAKSSQR